MRNVVLTRQALEDMKYWSQTDSKLLRKTFELIESALREPFQGLGKPEALKGNLKGFWSRRINDEHRMVYSVSENSIVVASFRSHYRN
jgi:toxin YoeB